MKLPQLSLRDLFWLVLVAACLCGWWAERRALISQYEAERAKLELLGSGFWSSEGIIRWDSGNPDGIEAYIENGMTYIEATCPKCGTVTRYPRQGRP